MRRLFFCLMALMGVLTLSAQSVYENEVINNIMTRTSIRQYTNEPVSKADIETMLRAGMAAPTAVNKQPWHFVAVTNKEKLAELAGRRGMIKQAGVAIVVCGNLDKAMQGKAQEYAKGFYESVGFKQSSHTFMLDGIPHIKMTWENRYI